MKAVVYTKYGSPEVLQFKDVEKPTPKGNEVLIKIHATTVAAADVRMRKADPFLVRIFNGLFNPKKVNVLGLELAGEIVETGSSVKKFKKGDKVLASPGFKFGGYAEYIAMPENAAIATMPVSLTYTEAATIPVGSITALYFLKGKGKIQNGQNVLIYGASGSVGTYAVQLAKYFGATVTAVCSTANAELMRSLGVENVIDYTKQDFTKSEKQYDMIFDAVGKVSKSDLVNILNPNGKFVSVKKGDGMHYSEHLSFLTELIAAGRLKPVIDTVYSFEEIVAAHAYVEKGHKKGNVAIAITGNTSPIS